MSGRATILYVDSKKLPKTFTTKEIFDYFVTLDIETITGIILDAILNRYDNRIQIVQTALKVGFNINRIINNQKNQSNRLIELATRKNDLETFLLCIKEKADISKISSDTLLNIAIYSKNLFAIKYFCKTMNLDKQSSFNMTPLDTACRFINAEIVDILVWCKPFWSEMTPKQRLAYDKLFGTNGDPDERIRKVETVYDLFHEMPLTMAAITAGPRPR